MKYLSIPMSVLLLSLSGHNVKARDVEDIEIKKFTNKLKRDIAHYNFEISIFSEDDNAIAPKILEKVGDQDVAGVLRQLRSPRGQKDFNRQFSDKMGQKPKIFHSKKIANFFKTMKVKFFYVIARAKSYKAQKDCLKFVLRLQENGA